MKLIEALDILQRCRAAGAPFRLLCACGFTPLHLSTFLRAHISLALPGRSIEARTGLYGDLNGTLRQAADEPSDAVVVTLEWPDLDPRLSVRQLGGWEPERLPEIAEEAPRRLAQIRGRIAAIAAHTPVAVSLPTLPMPPAAFQPPWLQSPLEAALAEALAQFSLDLSGLERVSVLNSRELDRTSPLAARHDVKAELSIGFPYQIAHADALASCWRAWLRRLPLRRA